MFTSCLLLACAIVCTSPPSRMSGEAVRVQIYLYGPWNPLRTAIRSSHSSQLLMLDDHRRRDRAGRLQSWPSTVPAPTGSSPAGSAPPGSGRSNVGGLNSGDWSARGVASTEGGEGNSFSPAGTTPISTTRRAVTSTRPSSDPTALLYAATALFNPLPTPDT